MILTSLLADINSVLKICLYVWFEVKAEVVIGLIIRKMRPCVYVSPPTPSDSHPPPPKKPFLHRALPSLPHTTLTPMKAKGHSD